MTGPFKLKKGKDLEDFFKSATKTPNPTTKADVKPERDEEEFMNEQDYQSVPTFHNAIPGPHDEVKKKLKKQNERSK